MPDERPSLFNKFSILFGLIGIILGFLTGFTASRLLPSTTVENPTQIAKDNTENTPMFTSQFATLNGKVIQIDDSSVTVQNGSNTAKFPLNQPIFISKPSSLSRPASPSGDIKIVPLNEFATLNLQKIDDQFKVTSINLLPPVGSPAPIPSDFPLSPAP